MPVGRAGTSDFAMLPSRARGKSNCVALLGVPLVEVNLASLKCFKVNRRIGKVFYTQRVKIISSAAKGEIFAQ